MVIIKHNTTHNFVSMALWSSWSDTVSASTYGLPPSAPEPPRLIQSTTHSLQLSWDPLEASPSDVPPRSHGTSAKPAFRYQLEMQEGEARQHFRRIFDGLSCQYYVDGLRRCSLYRFRISASNADGQSPWSDVVAFRTGSDVPTAPKGLRVSQRWDFTDVLSVGMHVSPHGTFAGLSNWDCWISQWVTKLF